MNIINKYDEYIIAEILEAYLIKGKSHREIQREILGLPAPDRGGGFKAMEILHYFNIKGEKKGIFRNSKNLSDIEITGNGLKLLRELIKANQEADEYFNGNQNINKSNKPTERDSIIKTRVFQDKLRKIILSNYDNSCALCDINKTDLLVCSHIVPWNSDEDNRLNPQNSICLCVLHDRLFDRGYFSLDSNYNILLSQKSDKVIRKLLKGLKFKKPIRNSPNADFLKFHFKEICCS